MYRPRSHNLILMSAIGAALATVGGSIASAVDRAEEAVVIGTLRCTHAITEQVCEFDSVEALDNFLTEVADRHNWQLPPELLAASAPIPQPTVLGDGVQTAALAELTGVQLGEATAVATQTYTDGASATGTAPLPDVSPAQQDAAQVSAAEATTSSAESAAGAVEQAAADAGAPETTTEQAAAGADASSTITPATGE